MWSSCMGVSDEEAARLIFKNLAALQPKISISRACYGHGDYGDKGTVQCPVCERAIMLDDYTGPVWSRAVNWWRDHLDKHGCHKTD